MNELLKPLIYVYPGITTLFLVSAIVNTLSFLFRLKRTNVWRREIAGYLVVWILFNYALSLVLLILILPEDEGLNQLSKTLFVFCVFAAALPESITALRVEIGSTHQALDFYKYRRMLSDVVDRHVESAETHAQLQQKEAVLNAFHDRIHDLRRRLEAFGSSGNVTDDDRSILNNCLKETNDEACIRCLLTSGNDLSQKVLLYLQEDVIQYERSATARLVKNLYPRVTVDEAQKLISADITSPLRLYLKAWNESACAELSKKCEMNAEKLALIRNETRHVLVSRSIRVFGLSIVSVLILLILLMLMQFTYEANEQQVVKEPGEALTEQIEDTSNGDI